MKLNPFKKDTEKVEKTGLFKEVEAKTNARIAEIEKLSDPAERVAQYEVLSRSLQKFYNDGKPDIIDHTDGGLAVFMATSLGGMGAVAFGTGVAVAAIGAAPVVVPLGIAAGLAAAVGGFRTGELFSGRHKRKDIRDEYGSVKNAKRQYKLQQAVKKRAEKDRDAVRTLERKTAWQEKKAEWSKNLDNSFNTQAGPIERPAPNVLKSTPRVIRTQPTPEN